MKRKKKSDKKLSLNKITIAHLEDLAIDNIYGGNDINIEFSKASECNTQCTQSCITCTSCFDCLGPDIITIEKLIRWP